MGKLGFFGCPIPEEYGGSNLGFMAHTVVTEEIAKISGSLRAAFNMQTMGTAREIFQFGTEPQKKKYVPKLVSAEYLGCIGITEPNAGSDVGSLKTRAERGYLCLYRSVKEIQGHVRLYRGHASERYFNQSHSRKTWLERLPYGRDIF